MLRTLHSKQAASLFAEWTKFAQECGTRYGSHTTVKILKDLNTACRFAVIGQYPQVTGRVGKFGGIWFRQNANGIPMCLPILRDVINNGKAWALEVTSLVRGISTKVSLDTQSIENQSKVSPQELYDTVCQILENINIDSVTVPDRVRSHVSLRAGPNHKVSLLSSGLDALALFDRPDDLKQFVHHCIETGNGALGRQLFDFIKEAVDVHKAHLQPRKSELAKLAFIPAEAGKTRVVYILNWWIQEMLFQLHNVQMKWLSRQHQDGTYAASACRAKVKEWTRLGKPCYCFDLTAATDRWPREYQHMIIALMCGENWSNAWEWAMTRVPFSKDLNRYVPYAVGQPMGAYSSWSTFSISHHYAIRSCIKRVGAADDCYVIIGDDLVISDTDVANAYLAMCKGLGVDINMMKSPSPLRQAKGRSSAEFAKALFLDGQDLTPFPIANHIEVFGERQTLKAADSLDWYLERGMASVHLRNDSLRTSLTIENYLSLLKEKEVPMVLAQLLNPLRVERLKANPTSNEEAMCIRDAPWSGAIGDTLHFLSLMGDEVSNRLSQKLSILHEVRDAWLKGAGQDSRNLPEFLLRVTGHPIQEIIRDLDEVEKSYFKSIELGETPKGFIDVLTDLEYVLSLLEGKESKHISRLKARRYVLNSIIVKIWKNVHESNNECVPIHTDW